MLLPGRAPCQSQKQMSRKALVKDQGARFTKLLATILLLQPGGARAQTGTPSSLPTLTTAQQVRLLSPDEANRGYPVRLRAVVTYSDPANQDFFVQDGSAGIYVDDPSLKRPFVPGEKLEIEGVTEDLDFAPQVGKPHYRILGQVSLPTPEPASFDSLVSTREDSQFVQFDGIVQSATLSANRLILDVLGGGGHLNGIVLNPGRLSSAQLVDARVRLQGVCSTIFNQNRQLTGVQLDVPSPRQLIILEPPVSDPFTLPVRALSEVMAFTPQGSSEHRIRVQGTVTLQRPRGLFIQDGNRGLFLPGTRREDLQPGTRVDAVGFADVGEYTPVIRQAVIRRAASFPLSAPIPVTASQALGGGFDAVRVRLEATVRDQRHSEADQEIVAQNGDVLFEARIEQNRVPRGWPNLPPGTRVKLTGVCSVAVDRDRQPTGFAVLLDSPADLVVLARPSWWTLRRALAGLTALALVALVVLAWVAALRGRVREQTEFIRRRLESEAALERRLEYVMRSTNDEVWDWDLRAETLWRSDGVHSVLEYRPSGTNPRSEWWQAHVHPEDGERVSRGLAAVVQGPNQQWSDEYRFRRESGDYAWIFDRAYVIRDTGGHAVRVIGAMMDVSVARKAQEDLRASEEKYRSLVTNIPDAIWTADAEGRFAYVSPKFEQLSGYTLQEIKERGVALLFESVHPDERQAVMAAFHSIFTEGHGEIECRVRHKDGDWAWLGVRAVAVYEKNGAKYADGLISDITPRKRAEEALRQNEESFRLLFLDNPLPMWVYHLDSLRFLEVNASAVAYYGYTRAEFLAMRITDIRPEADLSILNQTLAKERPILEESGPWRHRLKSGRVIDVQVASHCTKWNGVEAVLVVAQDVTERKRAEEALRKRTAELERSNTDLERSNAELEQFAYVASHDLQEPLRMVANFTQLLADRYQGRLDEDADEFIGFAVQGASRMRALIDGLLSFARVKSRARELQQTDCEAVLGRCLTTLRTSIREADARVTHDPLPLVLADRMQLEQIVQNLVGNALKFRNSRPPRIHVSALRSGAMWTFAVKDNGIGIDPDYHEKIFVIFQRLHARQAYPGTGIGLAICKRIVERHGGRIWVDSAEDKGATFYFTIPALPDENGQALASALQPAVQSQEI